MGKAKGQIRYACGHALVFWFITMKDFRDHAREARGLPCPLCREMVERGALR